MNERIRELAREAGIKMTHDETLALGYLDTPHKKFAELIVRECIKVIKDSEGYSQYFPHVTDNVEKKFGVEE
jgi:O-acetylhomoserine/O-acetylserine sulfhydrylase-like pyridoxal-dependent enzyme